MKNKSEARIKVIAGIIIAVLVLVGLPLLIFFGGKDATIEIGNNELTITGMYGTTVSFEDINAVSLLEESMDMLDYGRRVNGYGGIGQAAKGNFTSETLGEILLFVQLNASPTIFIDREEGKDIFISYTSPDETRALYEKIQAALE